MYHCDNNIVTDIEDLLYDFLNYRKNKKQNEIKMRAVPFYTQSLIEDVDFDLEKMKELPKPVCSEKSDSEYLSVAKNELNQQLDTIIDEVLNDYEYDGSPIFNDEIDRETLAQIVQRVIDLAIQRIDELKDVKTQAQNFGFNQYIILKALAEALIINNIFLKRKPIHKNFNKFMPY